MASSDHELIGILYQALLSPCGLLLQCSDVEQARQKFYMARRKAEDPQLGQLQIRVSNIGEGELMLTKGARYKEEPTELLSEEPDVEDLDLGF